MESAFGTPWAEALLIAPAQTGAVAHGGDRYASVDGSRAAAFRFYFAFVGGGWITHPRDY